MPVVQLATTGDAWAHTRSGTVAWPTTWHSPGPRLISRPMSQPSTPTAPPPSLRRSVSNTLKGSAGNLIEWYDVYVYSVFAVYFESKFFSPDDKNATLYVWAIFAMTFLMRPIGAWYFG